MVQSTRLEPMITTVTHNSTRNESNNVNCSNSYPSARVFPTEQGERACGACAALVGEKAWLGGGGRGGGRH